MAKAFEDEGDIEITIPYRCYRALWRLADKQGRSVEAVLDDLVERCVLKAVAIDEPLYERIAESVGSSGLYLDEDDYVRDAIRRAFRR